MTFGGVAAGAGKVRKQQKSQQRRILFMGLIPPVTLPEVKFSPSGF
jgi:hypothetical protein